eukprot:15455744-Alexandrium_andersonii.AAC.1
MPQWLQEWWGRGRHLPPVLGPLCPKRGCPVMSAAEWSLQGCTGVFAPPTSWLRLKPGLEARFELLPSHGSSPVFHQRTPHTLDITYKTRQKSC